MASYFSITVLSAKVANVNLYVIRHWLLFPEPRIYLQRNGYSVISVPHLPQCTVSAKVHPHVIGVKEVTQDLPKITQHFLISRPAEGWQTTAGTRVRETVAIYILEAAYNQVTLIIHLIRLPAHLVDVLRLIVRNYFIFNNI